MTDPDAFVLRSDEVMFEIASEVVVAFERVVFPLNVFVPENVFESASNVVDAPVCADVSTYTEPVAVVLSVPTDVVESVNTPANKLVVEAVVNDPYVVDAKPNRFTPENVFESVRSVVDDTVSDPPSATDEPLIVIDEFVRPVLLRVPVTVGVTTNAPSDGTNV